MTIPERQTDLEREASSWTSAERRLLELAQGLDRSPGLPEVPVEHFLVELQRAARRRETQRRWRLVSAAAALLLLSALAGWLEFRTPREQPLDAKALAQGKASTPSAATPRAEQPKALEPDGSALADGRANPQTQGDAEALAPELDRRAPQSPETSGAAGVRAPAVPPSPGETTAPGDLLADSGHRLSAETGSAADGSGVAEAGQAGSTDADSVPATDVPSAEIAPIRAAFERVWQHCAASFGDPTAEQLAGAAWWSAQPSRQASLRAAFATERVLARGSSTRTRATQHALDLLASASLPEFERGDRWPADYVPAMLWLGFEHVPRAASGLIERALAGDSDQGLALRALALHSSSTRETQAAFERALRDPTSAGAAVAALFEWPTDTAGRLLGNAWRSALSVERPAGKSGLPGGPVLQGDPVLQALASGLLALGSEGAEVLLAGLDAQTGARSAGQAAALLELNRLGDPEFAALLPKLTERLTREHQSCALALLAQSARPAALLALLELQALFRGPEPEIANALKSGACAAPDIWSTAAASDLERPTRVLLLESLLARGGPAEALPSLIAQADLPLDARLWAASLVGDLDNAAAAQHLLEVSLALGPGQERLAAAGLQAVVRCLGMQPTLARLRATLGDQLGRAQWARLEANLEREQQQSRPLRLAEQLRPLLPLLLPDNRAD